MVDATWRNKEDENGELAAAPQMLLDWRCSEPPGIAFNSRAYPDTDTICH